MLPTPLWLLCLVAAGARAQDSSSDDSSSSSSASSTDSSSTTSTSSAPQNTHLFTFTNSFSTLTGTLIPSSLLSGSDLVYLTPTGQSTVTPITQTITTNGTVAIITETSTATSNSQITVSSQSVSLTVIGGLSPSNTTANQTSTSTSSAAQPTNTLPCNGWPEFCTRKYSNITVVAAHNAAFVVKNNAASNQELPIRTQLDDGVRMLQGELQWENNTLWNCHTSCTLLNAGTWQSELEVIREWLEANPYEVLTLLLGNSDQTSVENFVPPLTNAGLLQYVYEPAYVPQYRDQWPTLGEMILTGKRLVIFMDYKADQAAVPYIMDELTHMWATPFSPVDQGFPCDLQEPEGLNETEARENYMYLANHNLNVAVDLSSLGSDETILIPNTAELNLTNAQGTEYGMLGLMSQNCTSIWGRPPTFLIVDYYNVGSPEDGSVFHVAAAANGVTYDKACCGLTGGAVPSASMSYAGLAIALTVTVLLA